MWVIAFQRKCQNASAEENYHEVSCPKALLNCHPGYQDFNTWTFKGWIPTMTQLSSELCSHSLRELPQGIPGSFSLTLTPLSPVVTNLENALFLTCLSASTLSCYDLFSLQ